MVVFASVSPALGVRKFLSDNCAFFRRTTRFCIRKFVSESEWSSRKPDFFLRNDPPSVSGDGWPLEGSRFFWGNVGHVMWAAFKNTLFVYSLATYPPLALGTNFPFLCLEDNAMDYDAYDALLHYIFKEVGHHHPTQLSCSDAFFRRRAKHGSSHLQRTCMRASAFESSRGNIAFSLMRIGP